MRLAISLGTTTSSDTMRYPPEVRRLLELNGEGVDLDAWLVDAEGAVQFLCDNAKSERLVLYASLTHVLVHCVLAPLKQAQSPDHDELGRGFVAPDAAWRIEHVSGGGKGHAAPARKAAAAKAAVKEYETYHAHFASLAAGCDYGLATVMAAMGIADRSTP
jgi:hypothetical protein